MQTQTFKPWPRYLGQPINPEDTRLRYVAQSILQNIVPDPLPDTVEQAMDVIRWHEHKPVTA